MKHFKRSFFVYALAILTVFLLVGCKKETKSPIEVTNICSFESYDEILRVELSSRFGKLALNTDEEFVTDGKGSMAVMPYGDFEQKIVPQLKLIATSKFIDKVDYTKTKYATLDIFNTANDAKEIEIYFTAKDINGEEVVLPKVEYSLNPQEWNHIVYSFYAGSMNVAYELNNICDMNIKFKEYRKDSEEYTPIVYYVDNFACAEDFNQKYVPSREKNEVIFFENLLDVNLLRATSNCKLVANTSKLYISQGKVSAKIIKTDKQNASVKILKDAIDFESFAKAKTFSMDVFNADSVVGYFKLNIYYNDKELFEKIYEKPKVVQANGMTTFLVTVDELPKGITFNNVTKIELQISSMLCYIDNIKAE